MEQYIKKSDIVAEIRRRFDEYSSSILKHYDACKEAKAQELGKILTILDTIEVKEVDLKEEIADIYEANYEEYLTYEEFADIAKHFLELGLNSQRKISYVPNIDDSLKELGVDPDSKEAKIFKESYYTALEKLKAQKGE